MLATKNLYLEFRKRIQIQKRIEPTFFSQSQRGIFFRETMGTKGGKTKQEKSCIWIRFSTPFSVLNTIFFSIAVIIFYYLAIKKYQETCLTAHQQHLKVANKPLKLPRKAKNVPAKKEERLEELARRKERERERKPTESTSTTY